MATEILRRESFPENELEQVKRTNPVILKSGGPIMELLIQNKAQGALCEWEDGRAWFPLVCLYKLVEMD